MSNKHVGKNQYLDRIVQLGLFVKDSAQTSRKEENPQTPFSNSDMHIPNFTYH